MSKRYLFSLMAVLAATFIFVSACVKSGPTDPVTADSTATATCVLTATITATISATSTAQGTSTVTPTVTPTAQTVTALFRNDSLPAGYDGGKDTFIDDINVTLINGACAWTAMSGGISYGIARTLMYFDLSSIPSTAVITYVGLSIYLYSDTAGGGIKIHPVTTPWSEGSACNNSGATGGATWNEAVKGTSSWATAGGDYNSLIEAGAVSFGAITAGNYFSFTSFTNSNLADMVQGWVSVPANNHGMLIKAIDETVDQAAVFCSGNHTTETLRPLLQVQYIQ